MQKLLVLVTFISLVSNFMDTKEIALNVISNKELNVTSNLLAAFANDTGDKSFSCFFEL